MTFLARKRAWLVGVAVIALGWPMSASARVTAGHLDRTFAGKGWAITPFGVAGEEADVEVAGARDGSAVVSDPLEGRVVRFLANGSRDRGFGGGGEIRLGPGTGRDGVEDLSFWPRATAVDGRGRVLVFGEQTDAGESFDPGGFNGAVPASYAVVLRFTAAGRPDPSFGDGEGFVRDDFGLGSGLDTPLPMVGALAGRADSRDRPVLVADVSSWVRGCDGHGGVGPRPRAVVRLTRSGRPDPTFCGGDGVSPIEGSGSFPVLGIDGDDRPAVGVGSVGGYGAECGAGGTVYRLRRDGERLSAFGRDGARTFERRRLDLVEPSGATILSDRHGRTLGVARIRADGSRDMGFGRDGVAEVHLPFRAGLHVSPAAVERSGRILLAGFASSPASGRGEGRPRRSSFVVARLLPDGRLDRAFGRRGWVFTRLPRPLRVTAAKATLDSRGRLLVAGTVTKPHQRDGAFAVARYLLGP